MTPDLPRTPNGHIDYDALPVGIRDAARRAGREAGANAGRDAMHAQKRAREVMASAQAAEAEAVARLMEA